MLTFHLSGVFHGSFIVRPLLIFILSDMFGSPFVSCSLFRACFKRLSLFVVLHVFDRIRFLFSGSAMVWTRFVTEDCMSVKLWIMAPCMSGRIVCWNKWFRTLNHLDPVRSKYFVSRTTHSMMTKLGVGLLQETAITMSALQTPIE